MLHPWPLRIFYAQRGDMEKQSGFAVDVLLILKLESIVYTWLSSLLLVCCEVVEPHLC